MQRNEQRPNKKSPQPNAGERTIGELLVERWRRQAGLLAIIGIPTGCATLACALNNHHGGTVLFATATLCLSIGFARTWFHIRWFVNIVRKKACYTTSEGR